jgi:acyl dehydratase
MINLETQSIRTVAATVGADTRFEGSAHDDEAARKLGFEGALVPGPAVASFMSHMFVEAWGQAWLRRGVLIERQRRPVYEGQALVATAEPMRREVAGLSTGVVLVNDAGETVALATGELPDAAPSAPDLRDFPLRAHFETPPTVGPEGARVGDLYRTTPFVYTQAIHDDYLDRVRETLAIYADEGVAHAGYLVKLTMHDAVSSFRRPAPGVHVAVNVQHFDLAHVGDTLSSAGQVVGVQEKNGRQYVESEQLVIANGQRPIAMVRRTSISSFTAKA